MSNVVHGSFSGTRVGGVKENNDSFALGDIANDVLCMVIEMLQGDGDLAARTMLLAVARLTHDAEIFGKETAVSTTLLEATRTAIDAFHNPPPAAA